MKFFGYIFITLFAKVSLAQEHEIKFLFDIKNESEVIKLYDSIQLPLVIYKNKVFEIHTECIPRNFGGISNDRGSGGSSNDRSSGGTSNERDSGGNSNNRNSGGISNDRGAGGSSSNRNSGGTSNNRSSGGNSDDRNSGGIFTDFGCNVDSKGKLIIYFHNMNIDKSIKIYYNNSFLTIKNQHFKLKKV